MAVLATSVRIVPSRNDITPPDSPPGNGFADRELLGFKGLNGAGELSVIPR